MLRRTNWGGSIATFIIVTVILLAGLVGTIYLMNQRSKQAKSDTDVATTSTTKQTDSEKSNSDNEKDSKGTAATDSTPNNLGATGYLPQTGPELLLGEVTAVYSLSASLAAYVISRKRPKTYL